MTDTDVQRWPASSPGRSRAVAFGEMVWLVANARDLSGDFAAQVNETLSSKDRTLSETESRRSRILSLQVLLTEIENRKEFDEIWKDWVGPDPASWPQRAVYQAGLAPGLLVEMIVVAARG